MYISGPFGKVQIGNNYAVSYYVGGLSDIGPVRVSATKGEERGPNKWVRLNSFEIPYSSATMGMGDSQKIAYFTPKINTFLDIFFISIS